MGGEVVPDMVVVEATCHVAFFLLGGGGHWVSIWH